LITASELNTAQARYEFAAGIIRTNVSCETVATCVPSWANT
jgi:hypothetical protein